MVRLRNAKRELVWLDPDTIVASDRNPRGKEEFHPDALAELLRSVGNHGVLQPLIVTPLSESKFRLVEGERRWRVARTLGLTEVPVYVIDELSGRDEVITMYHLHMQREQWHPADELRAISQLRHAATEMSAADLADELGMSTQTLRNRLRVLDSGSDILGAIERGELGFTAALRAAETADALRRSRSDLVRRLGGEREVRKQLAEKGKRRRGLAPELVELKSRLANSRATSDEAVERYIRDPAATKADLVSTQGSARPGRRRASRRDQGGPSQERGVSLAARIKSWRQELRRETAEVASLANREQLKVELALLIEAAEGLERALVVEGQLAAST